MDLKSAAAKHALAYIQSDMLIGLGTGSTSDRFVEQVAQLIDQKKLTGISGVATSLRTERLAQSLGIQLRDLNDVSALDITIDGTDEVDPDLNLIKGNGGALTREKIVARCSKQYIIITDNSKRVSKLGSISPLPIEVLKFGWAQVSKSIRSLGAEPVLRMTESEPYLTDGGNFILDCKFSIAIPDPIELDRSLNSISGVIEHGLFIGMADRVIVASEPGIEILEREGND